NAKMLVRADSHVRLWKTVIPFLKLRKARAALRYTDAGQRIFCRWRKWNNRKSAFDQWQRSIEKIHVSPLCLTAQNRTSSCLPPSGRRCQSRVPSTAAPPWIPVAQSSVLNFHGGRRDVSPAGRRAVE